jgi:hypothetical protein
MMFINVPGAYMFAKRRAALLIDHLVLSWLQHLVCKLQIVVIGRSFSSVEDC